VNNVWVESAASKLALSSTFDDGLTLGAGNAPLRFFDSVMYDVGNSYYGAILGKIELVKLPNDKLKIMVVQVFAYVLCRLVLFHFFLRHI
jgi:hypothetical protein